ncbi:MAG: hypothetical protein WC728_07485 [Elusimicrobiota bacterium]
MESDEIQRELDRLWQRVTAGPPEAGLADAPAPEPAEYVFSDPPSITREVSDEAIALIKNQHRAELARLQQLLELKEQSLRQLTDRLAAAQREIAALRRRAEQDERRLYQEVLGTSVELENAQKALKGQEERFAEQERVLRGVAEGTRAQLAAEIARWRELERAWNEREQQYLLDIRELEARAQRTAEVAARHEGQTRQSGEELKAAKNAVESTLSELLKERSDRESADKERDKALARVKEVEEHVRHLQNLWEEERKQWQELWDRERSTWETQRQEFASWEDKVRKERETWHANLQAVESRQTRHAEGLADILRKSSEAGEKVTSLVRVASEKVQEIIGMRERAAQMAAKPRPRIDLRNVWRALAAAALLAILYPAYRYATRLSFSLFSSHALAVDSPTGMAYDGDVLMLLAWGGEIVSLDPEDPSRVLSSVKVEEAGAYHPVSAALWGDSLFSLDSAQGRILRHPAGSPAKVAMGWGTPGPAPVALAHDGRNLWSYDAASRAFYRHLGEGPASENEAYQAGMDILPGAMCWHKDRLWVYDAKGGQMLAFGVQGRGLKLLRSAPFPFSVQGMVLTVKAAREGRQRLELWALAAPASSSEPPTLKKFRVRGG